MEAKAIIYINTQLNTVTKLDQQRQMSAIISKYVPAAKIIFVNVAFDYVLQSRIVNEGKGKRGFPQAYIGDERIGVLEEVQEADRSGYLEEVCNRGMNSSLNFSMEPSSDLLDSLNESINNTAYTSDDIPESHNQVVNNENSVESQSSTVTSWVSATAWIGAIGNLFSGIVGSGSGSTNSNVDKEEKEEVQEYLDFADSQVSIPSDVIDITFYRTNWYYRSQERIYRFNERSFTRIDPTNKNVRAEFNYDNIDIIIQNDKNNVVIKFKDKSEEQHLWTDNIKNIELLIETITSKTSENPGLKILRNI